MNKFPSIFNDVIGPVMTGPSSSHTAGPARIGRLAGQFAVNKIIKADIYFETNGSFANTYKGQRSDKGLAGGLLGWEPEDIRMVNALTEAAEKGLNITFNIADFEAGHPNTVKLLLTDEKNVQYLVTGISVGGGMVEIIGFNGFEVSIAGDFYELVILCKADISDGIMKMLKENNFQSDAVKKSSNASGWMINFKLSKELPSNIIKDINLLFPIDYVRLIKPVLPVLSGKECTMLFENSEDIIKYCYENNKDLFEAAIHYECCRGAINEAEALDKMTYILRIMKGAVEKGILGREKMPYMLQHQAYQVKKASEEGRLLDLGVLNKIIYSAMAAMETSSSMGVIAAAPTAGSCGIIPGTLVPICESLGLKDEHCVKALFCSGLIGVLIAYNATFSAETCGCQAECGSASSMAAAGIVYLAGGNVRQALTAASLSLQNVLGLICDPVGGLAEIPCMTRNIMASANAVSCANMALAGVEEVIPLDEVIAAMNQVGAMLPSELRCTCKGGLAVTKTAEKLSLDLQNIKY